MFGDILSNLANELAGGPGLGASLNAGGNSAVDQAAHESVPDIIVGQGIANPTTSIASTAMLLDWIGERSDSNALHEAARAMELALDNTLVDPASRTPDMGDGLLPALSHRRLSTRSQRSEPMKTVALPAGETVPALGLGTWHMGERGRDAAKEVAALSRGLDLGMTLIDTAEMYGRGGAERVVAQAIAGRRDEVFIVSKVLPYNASRRGTIKACEDSLRRLSANVIDLYLLHWPGPHQLADTVAAFEQLQQQGKIRHWVVSNFDLTDMQDLHAVPGGDRCQTNQVIYNLSRRGVEWDLTSWCVRQDMPIMAYSPLEQGRIANIDALRTVAVRHGVQPLQVALAWVLRRDGVIAIPKTSTIEHVEQNRVAHDLVLDARDLEDLDQAFPPPDRKQMLEML